MSKDGFWVVIWNSNALTLKNQNSVLDGSARVCSRVCLTYEACQMNGTPSPLYMEGDRVVWKKILDGFL
jgi:hypothetical protein